MAPLHTLRGPVHGRAGEERRSPVDPSVGSPPRIDVDEALRNGWFETWYQPKIDLKRKCLAGGEAVACVRHPRFGILLPGTFLPGMVENSISRLAEHALLATLHDWSKFDDAGFNLQLSMNVPPSVLVSIPIVQLVETHRPKSDAWPGIIVEVSEDQIVREMPLVQNVVQQLQGSGIKMAIDDFGAGYSSFSTLRGLPFIEIKLDSSFVKNCALDANNAAICQTAIDLAHRFGSAAVAGGIESATDLHALTVMGCDFGQGTLIAPAMPQERFLDLLRQRVSAAKPAADVATDKAAAQVAASSIGRVA
jgi:EAL domain-containing protein (putative c-di-GMP-specific phosphodiesterase class I)